MSVSECMARRAISAALQTARGLGLFAVSRKLTTDRLRILCYHGISIRNEHHWRPPLYMTRAKFADRLDYLKRAGYPVMDLDDALRASEDGTLPAGATVITFDDGFKDFLRLAHPEMAHRGLPSTLYVTTYHAVKRTPVFRLIVDYMFWLSTASQIDLNYVTALPASFLNMLGRRHVILGDARQALSWELVRYAETRLDEDDRVLLGRQIGHALGVDYDDIREAGLFGIVDEHEIRTMASSGVDIQLHTHRHILPEDAGGLAREISDNRRVLEPAAGPRKHFCYPSGIWSDGQLSLLRTAGIASATTCDVGMNPMGHDPLILRRFLDGQQVTQIRFEAEMSGFCDLLRDFKRCVAGAFAGLCKSKTIRARSTAPSEPSTV